MTIVNRIDSETIDLISPTDSGERRRIARDYALDHVVLAYASTVRGIQGETADDAIVGPDVDAAGLYVGLTRGRHHNEFSALRISLDPKFLSGDPLAKLNMTRFARKDNDVYEPSRGL